MSHLEGYCLVCKYAKTFKQRCSAMKFRPADAAKEVGVTVNTIRNWCKDYAKFLSEGAQPGQGNRVLSERDVEVFKYIAQLRKENMQQPQIVLRLRETRIGQIVPAEPANNPTDEPAALQEAPQQALVPASLVIDTLRSIEARLTALEQSQRATDERLQPVEAQRLRFDAVWLVVAAFIAGLIVGLSVWWFQ
jgi:DNA-binding transcriptional MerR regulator